MRTVCEIVVHDIMPTLRAAVAKELMANYNMNQGEVAKMLDVSQPAVSQYMRQLRGKSNEIEALAKNEIKELCEQLHSKKIDHYSLATTMCSISKVVIERGFVKGDFHKVDNCIVCKQ
ncbi:MAG TPA: winged helix-turn-helix transcriptional regulator [archaeon]|nr:winged helix-turn-helix transcriptional regulator [archaeon]